MQNQRTNPSAGKSLSSHPGSGQQRLPQREAGTGARPAATVRPAARAGRASRPQPWRLPQPRSDGAFHASLELSLTSQDEPLLTEKIPWLGLGRPKTLLGSSLKPFGAWEVQFINASCTGLALVTGQEGPS